MQKVIIVDDDFIVRTYLKQMLDWESQGFLLIADAKNGKEALDICQKEAPDIIITDMSMPVMNGMDLIKELKKDDKTAHINIIVLSCHDDFIYVKEAMQLGINDYLLKNDLTPEGLLTVLKKIKPAQKIISEDNKQKTPNDNALSTEELALIGKRKFQNDFFNIFGNEQLNNEQILLEQAKNANINSDFSKSSAILIDIKDWAERLKILEHEDILAFNQAFKDMCQNICQNQDYIHSKTGKATAYIFQTKKHSNYWGILLALTPITSMADIHKYLQTTADKIVSLTMRYFNLNATCYLTSVQKSLYDLKIQYHDLFNLITYSFYNDTKVINSADKNLSSITTTIDDLTYKIINDLAENISASEDIFNDKLNALFTELAAKQYTLNCLKQVITALSIQLNETWHIDWQNITDFMLLQEQLKQHIFTVRESTINKQAEHPAIRNALKYIDEHYKEQLSQQTVADFVHLNPAYFSTLFKKSLDITFSDYLINYRLSKVKKRLLTDSDKIKNIALDEGFIDYQYFCKLFKRVVGKSPSEYRHLEE